MTSIQYQEVDVTLSRKRPAVRDQTYMRIQWRYRPAVYFEYDRGEFAIWIGRNALHRYLAQSDRILPIVSGIDIGQEYQQGSHRSGYRR
ncbi:hypothetical protein CQ14_24240 [Bradyrhizobium lablabi]|uniref:Uncharacterized protein n=1 Tax=Bradyrhizobium lablabi TaxID=722472 RepID=A0A0R3MM02_9BRAD|nr:hypothetical protein CQ14_24240 [Bradyrhizobium lablabi]